MEFIPNILGQEGYATVAHHAVLQPESNMFSSSRMASERCRARAQQAVYCGQQAVQ